MPVEMLTYVAALVAADRRVVAASKVLVAVRAVPPMAFQRRSTPCNYSSCLPSFRSFSRQGAP